LAENLDIVAFLVIILIIITLSLVFFQRLILEYLLLFLLESQVLAKLIQVLALGGRGGGGILAVAVLAVVGKTFGQ